MASARLTGLIRRLHSGLVPAPAVGQTDREALRAFVARKDESAFAVVVQRHGAMVLRVCQRVLHHAQDAEDAFQATFLVLARKAATIGKSESLGSWLHGVAFRVSMRAKRDAGRRRAKERRAPIPVGSDPAEALAWRDVQILLEAEIGRLPERFRAAFVACYLEGRSRAEAAAELGIEENTLSSRLARARERLRHQLARRGVNLPAVLAAVALTTGGSGLAIPVELLHSTTRAATLFAARLPVTEVSSFTLQLTNGAMQTMAIAKLKWAVGVLAVGGTLAVGTWGAGQVPGTSPKPGSAAGGTDQDKPGMAERTADYAQRQRSLDNLKKIMVAMINYHDATGRFPADIVDKSGKPLLSWRVELLRYLDEKDLNKQFRRDEPWDSEHNLKLLARMPEVFRVGFEPKGATHTYYQRFAITGVPWPIVLDGPAAAGGPGEGGGAGAAIPGIPGVPGAPPTGSGPGAPGAAPGFGEGGGPAAGGVAPSSDVPRFPLRMTEVTDGTSYTLGVIETGPPVPWSKPADIPYDTKKPLPPLTGPFANVRHAGTLDGVVHALRPRLDETTLRRLIEPNDGQVVPELKTLRARFAADSEEEKKALAQLLNENLGLIATLEQQAADHAALLGLVNKMTRDIDQAEEVQEQLKTAINALKAKNKKLRDEIGLRPGAPVPK